MSSLLGDTNNWYCLSAIIILIITIVIVCNIHQVCNTDSKCHNTAIWSAANEACHLHVLYWMLYLFYGDINFLLISYYLIFIYMSL
jgi:hypothetical protein